VEVKKENLQKLIELIKEVLKDPKNKWFKEALLADIFGLSDDPEDKSWIAKINLIEQYLSIDGFQVIDYSFIENERVRNQLICDNIEMSRHRLGKRTGKVDFEEYCRFATLQIEELLNYFYFQKFQGDMLIINQYFSNNLSKEVNVRSISEISLSTKLKDFGKLMNLDKKVTSVIQKLINIRNRASHRSTIQKNDDSKIIQEAFENNLLGFVNYETISDYQKSVSNEAKNILFLQSMNFNDVEKCLSRLVLILSNR
jgi:hypothetical protein